MTHPFAQQKWNVIVIGTGMGGGTIGRALAEAGKKVLFVEFGRAGKRSEVNGLSETILPNARLARGLWPQPMSVSLNGNTSEFFAPIGAGVGGSSVFYAATLERPERHDLEATDNMPHPTGGWPVGFDAMRPWYDEAYKRFQVYGAPDPLSKEPAAALRTPPDFNATENALIEGFQQAGAHPYHAHTALVPGSDCRDCLGRKCANPECKMDGRSAGVEPALKTGNAALLTGAKVTRLLGSNPSIEGVEVLHKGQTFNLTADQYVLAAGALNSPRILLVSKNEAWPNGPCNENDLVGRNLMFHLNELFAFWPKGKVETPKSTKAISVRDFYARDGQRFGTLQAMGIKASYGEIHHYLCLMMARSRFGSSRLTRELARIPAALAEKLCGHAQIFVGLMEDLPYPENRVLFDQAAPDQIKVEYQFHDELLKRRKAFRRAILKGTKGMRRAPISLGAELNYGHPSGTLCYGTDPKNSVLNRDCRAHNIKNIWVADASFMPTSMGVNPSLTIAANALRVADQMISTKED
ncbi:MAG: GMC family oxidoreductase [Pseudomonadota bacterium]|nr:GMC family oxidoreductase [Pseudomonadota bacterium]